jgi:hypothetical protein
MSPQQSSKSTWIPAFAGMSGIYRSKCSPNRALRDPGARPSPDCATRNPGYACFRAEIRKILGDLNGG